MVNKLLSVLSWAWQKALFKTKIGYVPVEKVVQMTQYFIVAA